MRARVCVPSVLVTLLCASHRAELFAADSTLQAALEARGYAETIATTKKHKGVVQPRGLSLSLATHFRLTPGATGGRALGATLGALCLSPALSLSLSLSRLSSHASFGLCGVCVSLVGPELTALTKRAGKAVEEGRVGGICANGGFGF